MCCGRSRSSISAQILKAQTWFPLVNEPVSLTVSEIKRLEVKTPHQSSWTLYKSISLEFRPRSITITRKVDNTELLLSENLEMPSQTLSPNTLSAKRCHIVELLEIILYNVTNVCPCVHRFQPKTGEGMKMEKVPWDVRRDGVVVGVGWGVRERERGWRRNMPFGQACGIVQYFKDIRQGAIQCDYSVRRACREWAI